jgi:hypothetical protein
VAVLPNEQDAITLVECGNADSAGMDHDVPDSLGATGESHLIPGDRPDVTGEVLGARESLGRVRLIAQGPAPLAVGHG